MARTPRPAYDRSPGGRADDRRYVAAAVRVGRRRDDTRFSEVNLVSDKPGLARLVTDRLIKNPWGIALGPDTPLWVANNGTATATVYAGANGRDPISKVPLDVALPAAPTGQVSNPTQQFTIRGGGAS